MPSTVQRLVHVFASLSLLLLAPSVAGARTPSDQIVIEQGSVRLSTSETIAYEIGTLFVPENRNKPGSRRIGVGFARIKAPHPTGAPPIFWLPGGPGLSVLGAFADEGEAARNRLRSWLSFGAAGDLVVVELEADEEPREVEVPEDLAAALAADAATAAAFERISYTDRREYVEWVVAAKRPETRRRRVEGTVARLRTR